MGPRNRRFAFLIAALLILAATAAGIGYHCFPDWTGFSSNLVAGVFGAALSLFLALGAAKVYDEYLATKPWKPARDAALRTTAFEIGLLVFWLQVRVDTTTYTTYGVALDQLSGPPNDQVLAVVRQKAAEIGASIGKLNGPLLQSYLKDLQMDQPRDRLDRIRTLAFPLLAGTQSDRTVAALNAIEDAAQYGYLALEHWAAYRQAEPSKARPKDAMDELLRRLVHAYGEIVKALKS